jgi:hypothetical protein
MKKRLSIQKLLPLLLAALVGCQASSTRLLPDGETVGDPIGQGKIYTLAVVSSTPSDYFDETLLVEAEAVAVCQRKGCWMKVKDGDATAMVRWEEGCDGKYAFPTEIVGKRILIQGSFYPKVISDEDAAHIESEAGENVRIEREGFEFNASAILIPSE